MVGSLDVKFSMPIIITMDSVNLAKVSRAAARGM